MEKGTGYIWSRQHPLPSQLHEQIPFKNLETPEKSVQIANGYPSNLAALSLFLSCCWSFFTPAFFLPSLMSFWSFCLARSGDVSQKLCRPLSFLSLLFCPSEELEVSTFRITPSWIAYPARFPCLVNILPYLKWSWTSCEINIEIKSTLGWKKKNSTGPERVERSEAHLIINSWPLDQPSPKDQRHDIISLLHRSASVAP